MKISTVKDFIKFPVLIISLLLIFSKCNNPDNEHYIQVIDSIAAKHVPDHRIGVCNIKLKRGENGQIILSGETTSLIAKNEIIKTLNKSINKLIDSIIFLPDTLKTKNYYGLVTLSVINLRKEPDHRSELVSQAILGTPVIILKNIDSWVLIKTPDNYISWTEESSLKIMGSVEMAAWKKSARVMYEENTGWLYDTLPGYKGVVGDLVGGSIMEKTGESEGYVHVVLPDGRKGFVEKKGVMDFDRWKSSVSCTENSVCKVALSYLGVPYLWGGSSVKGVDCSGFVQSVYFRNGLILSRDASLQALHGLTVNISDGYDQLRRGDLLFFGSNKNGISHVTHVAIYNGNSEYINSAGRVMLNSIDSAKINYNRSRMNSLLSARRIIGVENDAGIIPVFKHPWY